MLHVPRWRVIAVYAAIVWSILFSLPNVLPASVKAGWPTFLPSKGVNLGLDLRGGSHLMLEVEAAALVKERMEQVSEELARELGKAKPRIAYTGRGVAEEAARLRLVDGTQLQRALDIAAKLDSPVPLPSGKSGLAVTSTPEGLIELRLSKDARAALLRQAVQQSIEVVRRRIDELGTSEVTIVRQGADRIVVQAPGENDPEVLKRRIGKTAKLTFHLLDNSVSPQEAASGRAPPGSLSLPQPGRPDEPFVVVKARALLSGDDLTRANASFDQRTGEPAVAFQFNQRGAREFGRITSQNVRKRFAIVLDGSVITAPSINEPILGGSGQISGSFDVEGAEELAALLRAGALPAPLKVIEQRSVGAGLGQDAIDSGAKAGMIAGVGVLIFMVLAYGGFGIVACLGLILNGLMVIAAMSMIGATLTLPGIAGLILTIAMAVDANVLIFERMREERDNGRGVALAIDGGFGRAIVTILDANITTLGAAGILFVFGVGPVRGFAWTLSLGVVTSVFTAVLVTQVVLAQWYRTARPKKLPI